MARPVVPADGDEDWGTPLRNAIFDVSDRVDTITSDVTNAVLKNTIFFNVKDFGAVGNGTIDDSVALQAAMDAAKAANGTMYIPKGTFRHATSLNASGNSFNIVGESRSLSILQYRGSGAAISHDDAANYTRRVWSNFQINTQNAAAGTVGADLRNVGRSQYHGVRFHSLNNTNGSNRCVRFTGITDDNATRSTYYNDFYSCEFNSGPSGYCLEFIGSANRNRFINGVFDGTGGFVKADQGSSSNNLGTMYFYGCAIANTNADALTLGMASGSVTRITNWIFVSCSWETGAASAAITLHPNVGGVTFLGCTRSGEVTFTDTDPTTNNNVWIGSTSNVLGGTGRKALHLPNTGVDTGLTIGDVEFYRSAAGTIKTNADLRVDSILRVGVDGLVGLTISSNTLTAAGTNTDVPVNINSKGTGRVQLNIGGSATGGTQIEKSTGKVGFFGAAPAVKPTVTGTRSDGAALVDLLAELAQLGLITDSSTAGTPGVVAHDLEVTDLTKGVILKSPNGTRYRLTVNNSGAVISTPL